MRPEHGGAAAVWAKALDDVLKESIISAVWGGGAVDVARPLQKSSFRPQRCWQVFIYSA